MSVAVKMYGRLEFDDDDVMNDALFEAAESLEAEDDDLKSLLDHEVWFAVGKDWVSIDFHVGIPADWFLAIDNIVENMCDYASSGEVRCWYEGEETDPYQA